MKIADHKDKEKTKIDQLEKKNLKHLTLSLSVLVVIQFMLNLSETSVYIGVHMNTHVVGIPSLFASITTFALEVLGKRSLNTDHKNAVAVF